MWNPCESHIPLNGCKDTNFSRTLQTFHTFSLNKYAFTLKSESKSFPLALLHGNKELFYPTSISTLLYNRPLSRGSKCP